MADVYQLKSKKIMAVRNGFYPAAQGAPHLESGQNHYSLMVEGRSLIMSEETLNQLFEPYEVEKEPIRDEVKVAPIIEKKALKEVDNERENKGADREGNAPKRGRPRKSV